MARPKVLLDNSLLSIRTAQASSKLQPGSERRAVINHLADVGGKATKKELDEHFGFDTAPKVSALLVAGWLDIEQPS